MSTATALRPVTTLPVEPQDDGFLKASPGGFPRFPEVPKEPPGGFPKGPNGGLMINGIEVEPLREYRPPQYPEVVHAPSSANAEIIEPGQMLILPVEQSMPVVAPVAATVIEPVVTPVSESKPVSEIPVLKDVLAFVPVSAPEAKKLEATNLEAKMLDDAIKAIKPGLEYARAALKIYEKGATNKTVGNYLILRSSLKIIKDADALLQELAGYQELVQQGGSASERMTFYKNSVLPQLKAIFDNAKFLEEKGGFKSSSYKGDYYKTANESKFNDNCLPEALAKLKEIACGPNVGATTFIMRGLKDVKVIRGLERQKIRKSHRVGFFAALKSKFATPVGRKVPAAPVAPVAPVMARVEPAAHVQKVSRVAAAVSLMETSGVLIQALWNKAAVKVRSTYADANRLFDDVMERGAEKIRAFNEPAPVEAFDPNSVPSFMQPKVSKFAGVKKFFAAPSFMQPKADRFAGLKKFFAAGVVAASAMAFAVKSKVTSGVPLATKLAAMKPVAKAWIAETGPVVREVMGVWGVAWGDLAVQLGKSIKRDSKALWSKLSSFAQSVTSTNIPLPKARFVAGFAASAAVVALGTAALFGTMLRGGHAEASNTIAAPAATKAVVKADGVAKMAPTVLVAAANAEAPKVTPTVTPTVVPAVASTVVKAPTLTPLENYREGRKLLESIHGVKLSGDNLKTATAANDKAMAYFAKATGVKASFLQAAQKQAEANHTYFANLDAYRHAHMTTSHMKPAQHAHG